MAHLLEHMLFKGTPTFPDVPKALRDHGAGNRFNGTTWVDRTNYYETMPATDENLEFGIKLEADRLVNSLRQARGSDHGNDRRPQRVRGGENNPKRSFSQRMMAVAYEWHNYGKSTIGNRSRHRTRAHREPAGLLRSTTSPITRCSSSPASSTRRRRSSTSSKYFGAEEAGPQAANTYTEEPAQDGERNVTLRRVGTVGATGVVYHIPAGLHRGLPGRRDSGRLLDREPAGRLYKALVEAKKASSVSGNAFGWHDPGRARNHRQGRGSQGASMPLATR